MPYQKQKSSPGRQLSSFLASLSPLKSIPSVTTEEIVKFLINKDGTGRTVVHTWPCDRKVCECRRRLTARRFGRLPYQELRAIYNNLGRSAYSNPVSHLLIKENLKLVRQEQANSAIVPKQAIPLFFEKFKSLVSHFRKKMAASLPLFLVRQVHPS